LKETVMTDDRMDDRLKAPTSAGSPGPARPAPTPHRAPSDRPTRGIADGHTVSGVPLADGELVIESSEESFPASDPPSYTGVTSHGSPRR
jgi:hypothetical protein